MRKGGDSLISDAKLILWSCQFEPTSVYSFAAGGNCRRQPRDVWAVARQFEQR